MDLCVVLVVEGERVIWCMTPFYLNALRFCLCACPRLCIWVWVCAARCNFVNLVWNFGSDCPSKSCSPPRSAFLPIASIFLPIA